MWLSRSPGLATQKCWFVPEIPEGSGSCGKLYASAKEAGFVTEEKDTKGDSERKMSAQGKQEVSLSNEYFKQLLHLPACKSKGFCDNCGRCER